MSFSICLHSALLDYAVGIGRSRPFSTEVIRCVRRYADHMGSDHGQSVGSVSSTVLVVTSDGRGGNTLKLTHAKPPTVSLHYPHVKLPAFYINRKVWETGMCARKDSGKSFMDSTSDLLFMCKRSCSFHKLYFLCLSTSPKIKVEKCT